MVASSVKRSKALCLVYSYTIVIILGKDKASVHLGTGEITTKHLSYDEDSVAILILKGRSPCLGGRGGRSDRSDLLYF